MLKNGLSLELWNAHNESYFEIIPTFISENATSKTYMSNMEINWLTCIVFSYVPQIIYSLETANE